MQTFQSNTAQRGWALAFVCGVFLAAGIVLSGLGPALPFLATRSGQDVAALGGLFTALSAGVIVAQFIAGPAGDRLGQRLVLAAGMVLAGLAAAAVALSSNLVAMLAAGLTVFLLRTIFGVKGAFQDPSIQGLGKIDLPGLAALPILGPLLSGHSWVIYLSWLLVLGMQLLLFRHALGLRMRGVGEHPEAAATLGVNVTALRYLAVLLSGALCGLAGAQLSLGNVTLFVENMSAGRGWIAVVAVMFGRAHPLGVLAASLLFGLADSLGFRLQGLQMPSQFTGMVPYVVTLVSLFIIEAQRRQRRLATS